MDMLLNWLWQGLVLAAAAAAALWVWPRSDPRARQRICWGALAALALLPGVPFVLTMLAGDATVLDPGGRVRVPVTAHTVPGPASLVALWCGWVLWSCARLVLAAVRVRRARATAVPIPEAVERRLRYWSNVRGQGRRTRIVVSRRVRAAAVLGVGSPVIAVAPDLLDGLDDDQLDLIVLHEWAHVQRRDDVANAVHLLVHVILGWHPAARWIASRLHLEREAAADHLAASTGGSPRRYAASLAALAVFRRSRRLLPVPAAESQLRARITRVLAPQEVAPQARVPRAIIVGVLGVVGVGAGAFQVLTTRAVAITPAVTGDVVLRGTSHGSTSLEDLRRPLVLSPRRESRARHAPPVARQPSSPAPHSARTVPTVGEADRSMAAGQPIPYLPAVREAVLPPPPPSWRTSARAAESAGSRAPGVAAAQTPSSPWGSAADSGAAVGRASASAASATARAFTRFGTKVAGAF